MRPTKRSTAIKAKARKRTQIRVDVGDDPGLDAIVRLVQLARGYESDIRLTAPDGGKADAKSVMQVFLFCQRHGNDATVCVSGPDAGFALSALSRYGKTTQRGTPPVPEGDRTPVPPADEAGRPWV